MRHVGCPFAEATAREMQAVAASAPAVDWVVVTHSSPAVTLRWCAMVGCEGVHLVEDESRALYASWGLGRSRLRHFLGWRSLRQVLRLRSEQGIKNTASDGTRWQKAGTFAVDGDGRVRWRHIPRHAGELPDLEAAVRALDLRDPLPR
jgi:AhpC/TSA antioxidant enzyme